MGAGLARDNLSTSPELEEREAEEEREGMAKARDGDEFNDHKPILFSKISTKTSGGHLAVRYANTRMLRWNIP
jgi:hypothetical protein